MLVFPCEEADRLWEVLLHLDMSIYITSQRLLDQFMVREWCDDERLE